MSNRPTRIELLAFAALLVMTAAWGSTFFMIKDVVTRMEVVDLLAVRFAIAGAALTLIAGRRLRMERRTVLSGVFLGAIYGAAQILQTLGLDRTSASVSGFITGLYVVATPLLAALLLRARIPRLTWVAALLATVGLGVLSLNGLSIGLGELLTLVSAVVYAGHIIALGRLAGPGTALALSVVQMWVIAALCTVAAFVPVRGTTSGVQLPTTTADWLMVVYLAVIAGAMTMVLQSWAQARIDASRAAVIMAMEPVWAAGFAVALGGEMITVRMVIGGLAILAAMYLVEVAPRQLAVRRDRRLEVQRQ